MSGRRGRRPLATEHVEALSGSERAKARLRVMLWTLQGTLTVDAACQQLRIGQSRFHALRREWLQRAVELLEPRRIGRPSSEDAVETACCRQLRERLEAAERAVDRARLRHTVDQVLMAPLAGDRGGKKKAGTTVPAARPAPR